MILVIRGIFVYFLFSGVARKAGKWGHAVWGAGRRADLRGTSTHFSVI